MAANYQLNADSFLFKDFVIIEHDALESFSTSLQIDKSNSCLSKSRIISLKTI